jgi:hypothetical protein
MAESALIVRVPEAEPCVGALRASVELLENSSGLWRPMHVFALR